MVTSPGVKRRGRVERTQFQAYAGLIAVLTIVAFIFLFYAVPDMAAYAAPIFALTMGALAFALWLCGWLLSQDDGDESMHRISEPIRVGAEAFLRVQNNGIGKIAALSAVVVFIIFFFRDLPPSVKHLSNLSLAGATTIAFILGAVFSAFAGYISMWVAVRANIRVASAAARYDYPLAVKCSIRGGAFTGIVVVALCVLGLTSLLCVYAFLFPADDSAYAAARVPHMLVGYGFGASLVALFAQLGGGIYTKAADVGADMVGKIEAAIPEDDPRNPAVIADLVGDNVGDCAGRGADLFESIGGEMIGAMILGSDLAAAAKLDSPLPFIFFPLLLHSFDLVISSVAVLLTTPRSTGKAIPPIPSLPSMTASSGGYMGDGTGSPVTSAGFAAAEGGQAAGFANATAALDAHEDVLQTMVRAYLTALAQAVVVLFGLSWWLLNPVDAPDAWWHFFLCGLIGCSMSIFFVQVTKYYTDYAYSPVLRIVNASRTGSGTNVIMGVAVGLESTALPALMISASLIGSYMIGNACGIVDESGNPEGGLFGTAVATMGMLSTAVYILAMDTFGPITDNAGGIVEMAELSEGARAITDRLDAVGNVTKATTKGYSIGAAGLASFLLFRAFIDVVHEMSPDAVQHIDIGRPEVFIGGFLGSTTVFLFASLSISAVGKSAEMVVSEVRLQFQQHPGILLGHERPDYDKCVSIVTQSALREMLRPGLLAILAPLAVGIMGRLLGPYVDAPALGAEMVAAFILFATGTGVLLSLTLNNAGGAWDNAKKYVELGPQYGGKGSDMHKAAVTGDTVGDPFKDTAGPSIHVLIKLLSTITLVACPLLVPLRTVVVDVQGA